MEESNLTNEAYQYVKKYPEKLIKDFAGSYSDPDEGRVSVFMAGAPGAGKTEFSRCLLREKFGQDTSLIVRIDPDEIRMWLPNYIEGKAELFNSATIKGVEILVDHCYEPRSDKSFLLDGTLSNIGVAQRNINRALKRNRAVQIFFVYKDPIVAWSFTQKREKIEGRNIPKTNFISHYFNSIETVNRLKEEYGKQIQVDLVSLEVESHDLPKIEDYKFVFNISSIDDYIQKRYSEEELMRVL